MSKTGSPAIAKQFTAAINPTGCRTVDRAKRYRGRGRDRSINALVVVNGDFFSSFFFFFKECLLIFFLFYRNVAGLGPQSRYVQGKIAEQTEQAQSGDQQGAEVARRRGKSLQVSKRMYSNTMRFKNIDFICDDRFDVRMLI